MFRLFYEGGPLFMGILTLLLLIVLVLAGRSWMKYSSKDRNVYETRRSLVYVKNVGILAFVVGVLGQLIGLYSAFIAIEEMGGVSPAMLAGGLKVSMITTLYGAIIFIIALLIWLLMDSRLESKNQE